MTNLIKLLIAWWEALMLFPNSPPNNGSEAGMAKFFASLGAWFVLVISLAIPAVLIQFLRLVYYG